ncbi:peroxisome biogenesis factor 2 isoform X2 [Sipha flava]|uniref:RING-type E3 ubiquitin transferase (cysteine targeting) n=1 Tax=Sipha flava TaxID=143950 RepID=A0A8B8G5S6_9HEMI|nr:peroxisome biogenesis factor 2 isoform X2 [Sipha flava]
MVSRVTLLDAHVLDEHITKIFINQTLKVFKFLPYSVAKMKATFGQQLLGIRFKPDQLTDTKIALFQFFMVVANYVQSKSERPSKNFINNINDLQLIVNILKTASFMNFLLFLHNGKYPTLLQRFLSLSQESTRKRNIEYTFMTRELLWHGFSELLMFSLPLINYQSVKHKINRLINSKSKHEDKKWVDKIPLMSARIVCSICHDKPVLPHHIKCSHVFCFYCISSMRMVDEQFECPECDHFEKKIIPVILN